MRISSIKVFSLLITSIGEATDIDSEYLLNVLVILIWCILKLETFISHLTSSVFYWCAVTKSVVEVSFQQIFQFIVQLFKRDSTLGRVAMTTENCNENENDAILLFKLTVLSAIKTIRNKKNMLIKSLYLTILSNL